MILQEKLLNTMLSRCRNLLIILVVLVALLIFDVVYKYKTKAERRVSLVFLLFGMKNTKPKFTLTEHIAMKAICVFIISFVVCTRGVATYNDIHNRQYLELKVQCIEEISMNDNIFSFDQLYVIDLDGKQLSFNLPNNFLFEDFPIGIGGTLWYSKETNVALIFNRTD
jgi:hypothetical protein